jgi:hypothetical protein
MSNNTYVPGYPAEQRAQELGLVMFKRPANVLMLDMDMPLEKALEIVKRQMTAVYPDDRSFIAQIEDEPDFLSTKSKSGNTHIYIRGADSKTDLEAIALQLFLGSDPKREAMSLQTINGWRTETTASVLFETPEEALRVQAWMEKMNG